MRDKIIQKAGLVLVAVMFALALVGRRRSRIPVKRAEVANLVAPLATILALVPSAFELPYVLGTPFFVIAAGLFVFAFRRLPPSAVPPPPDK